MSIGLPLIGAVPVGEVLHCSDDRSLVVENIHCIRISDAITLRIFTSDDITLETGGSVWHAGHALAVYLVQNPSLVQGKDVIELGAGCGLVGITAAALGARSVTLTDILNQQSHLAKNIELNRATWEKSCSDVNYGVLYFGDSEVTSIPGTGESDRQRKTFEVVLAADIGYDLSLHKPIYRTLVSLLQPLVDNCNMPTGEIYEALNTPRLQSQGIALLAEEVRWSDVHQWYIDCLVGPSEVEHDDYCSQVHMRSLCGGVSCSDGNCDDSCSNQTEVCQVSGSVRNHPPASRMIQKHSTCLTGKAEIASDEVHSLDGVNCRTDKLSTKKSASKKNAIHLVMLTSELIEKNVCAISSSPSSACIEIAAASH